MTGRQAPVRPRLGPVPWALLGGLVIYVLSRITGGMWLGLVGCAVIASGLVAVLLRRARPDVSVSTPTRGLVGSPSCLRVTARNTQRWPVPATRVTYEHDGFEPVDVLIPSLRPGEVAAVDVHVVARERGLFRAATLSLLTATPLGVSRRVISLPDALTTVHPRPSRPMTLTSSLARGAEAHVDRSGRGADVHGLRPWRPGDTASGVHWRSTARRGELLVLERAQHVGGGLAVLVGPLDPGSATEDMVAVTAATAVATIRDGQRVSLFGGGGPSVIGSVDRTAVLDWFAALRGVAWVAGTTAPEAARAVGAGGTVVWLSTAAVPADVVHLLRRAGVQVVVAAPGENR